MTDYNLDALKAAAELQRKATPERLAKLFHDVYERLAPEFGYETRQDTRQFDPESANGRLMIAVCDFVLGEIVSTHPALNLTAVVAEIEAKDAEIEKLQRFKDWVHAYLDNKGVPAEIDDHHLKEGCRIGGRMDYVFEEIERLKVWKDSAMKLLKEIDDIANTIPNQKLGSSKVTNIGKELQRLKSKLATYEEIAANSEGVIGWHLNGDIARWSEFQGLVDGETE